MLRDTRQEILLTAKRLFNEQGYNNVSTRDISGALGISKGNLTYYFKKKEDIMEALLTESQNESVTTPPESLLELNDFFVHIQKTVQDNSFYFWHHAQLAQLSPNISALQHFAFQKKFELMMSAFQKLSADGVLRKEEYASEYNQIINALFIANIYWLPFCKLRGMDSLENFTQQAWSILYPLLTETGKRELITLNICLPI